MVKYVLFCGYKKKKSTCNFLTTFPQYNLYLTTTKRNLSSRYNSHFSCNIANVPIEEPLSIIADKYKLEDKKEF